MPEFSDAQIIAEVRKLQVFYKLKTEIRYGLEREEQIDTESVAEHIFGMFILANYFLPLENPAGDWDKSKIFDLILYHDLDEVVTGDTIDYHKTLADYNQESVAYNKAIQLVPKNLQPKIMSLTEEYFLQQSPESQFVKALDKLEPAFHCLSENGKQIYHYQKTSLEQHLKIKKVALQNFLIMKRYSDIIANEMTKNGQFLV